MSVAIAWMKGHMFVQFTLGTSCSLAFDHIGVGVLCIRARDLETHDRSVVKPRCTTGVLHDESKHLSYPLLPGLDQACQPCSTAVFTYVQ